MSRDQVGNYFSTLFDLIAKTEVTDRGGRPLTLAEGFDYVRRAAREAHARGNKIMFIGNGGSAGISSHLAVDFSKNGGLRALAFNDGAMLTCLGNDLGYENVFAKQLEFHARRHDLLIAISSSGKSPNILKAVAAARTMECGVVTFSGFTESNDLRRSGDANFYVRSQAYGFVEVAHLALCHAILDIEMGWNGSA